MKSKLFSPFWRVTIALVLVLSMGLMAAPAGATNQNEAPAYVAKGDTAVLMLQFDVQNTNEDFARNFTGVRVSFSGDDLDDVLNVMVLDSGEGLIAPSTAFASSPLSFAFTTPVAIDPDATETYYIAIDIDASAADENLVSISLESIDGDTEVVATATLPFSSGETEIDADAPLFDSAITGDSADGNSTVLDNIYLSFTEEVSGLDSTTVATTDFTVANPARTVSSIVDVGDDYIVLGLDADLLTDDAPSVTLVADQSISDLAGNESITGESVLTAAASDGLKPTVDSVVYTSSEALTLTFSEDISLPGVKEDYSVNYAGRVVNVLSVDGGTLSAAIILNIEDQSLEDDPTDAGEFTVTVSNPGNVKDTNGNSVDPANNSASVDVDDFVTGTDIVSAVTVTTTTIDVTFSDDLDGTTVDETGFTVVGNTVVSAAETSPGVVTLTLETAIATSARPNVDYAQASGTLEDIAGIEVGDCTETTPDDGIAPTMDSAVTVDTTTIDVTFSEDIDGATVDEADFSVASNTVDSATGAGGVVTLTLLTEIATDATPDVTYTAGTLADLATVGNTAVTDTVTPTDEAGPVLETVTWIDVNGDEEVSPMDTLTFTFSEAMDQSTITTLNVDANLLISGKTYGTAGAVVSWTATDTVEVTLAIGENVAIGDLVNPHDNVTDALGNADATVADVTIEDLTDLVLLNGVHYPTIQDAIDAAGDGDIITVGPGTYEENLTVNVDDLTVESTDGRDTTIIDASGGDYGIRITASDVTVEGFTVDGAPADGIHIWYNTEGVTVKDNTVTDAGWSGICLNWNGNAPEKIVTGAEVSGNIIEDCGAGINLLGCAKDCEISGNTITGAGNESLDIHAGTSDDPTQGNLITGNIIIDNQCMGIRLKFETAVVDLTDFDDNVIELNTISGNEESGILIVVVDSVDPVITGLVIKRNDITGNADGIVIPVELDDDTFVSDIVTNLVIKYNDISGNTGYGIQNDSAPAAVDGLDLNATLNYWGAVTGPGADDIGGDEVTITSPWLHKSQSECEINSFPALTVDLSAGWNTLSAPAKLITTAHSVGELVPPGSGMIISYWYDAADVDEDGAYWESAAAHVLNPCDAVYIKMSSAHTVLFQVDGAAFYTPTKDLVAGWNLIGLARLEDKDATEAVASVADSFAQVVSPSMNHEAWVEVAGEDPSPSLKMLVGEGYWIFMKSGATLGGFTLCPIAPQY